MVNGVLDGIPKPMKNGAYVVVSPSEIVFDGHYPGAPILPGVCVTEYVARAALDQLPISGGKWALHTIESARFLAPVRPGDRMDIVLNWTKAESADWVCSAAVTVPQSTDVQIVARVRLRFTERDGEPS